MRGFYAILNSPNKKEIIKIKLSVVQFKIIDRGDYVAMIEIAFSNKLLYPMDEYIYNELNRLYKRDMLFRATHKLHHVDESFIFFDKTELNKVLI